MKIKVPIGYKFIIGFVLVVSTAAFAPRIVHMFDIVEWMQEPLSVLIAMVIGLLLGWFFTRSFTNDFRHLTEIANEISNGDLRELNGINVNGKILEDESTELAGALSIMLKNLKELLGHIKEASTNLGQAAETLNDITSKGKQTTDDISTGTSKIFEGALEQANHVENASSAVREMTKQSDDVADKATDLAAVASQTRSVVQRSVATSTSALNKMESILEGVDYTKDMILRLEEKINDIPKIMDIITHIARQTDLLALNATIEASKAGEHGRGFAIVAEEVRRFADNTKRYVEDVTAVVKDVKGEVERLVHSEAERAAFTQEGRTDLSKVKESLDEITAFTSEVADKAGGILTLTQKQKDGAVTTKEVIEKIAQIARDSVAATEDVDKVVEGHKASMDEVVASAQKLSELSLDLDKVITRFKLEPEKTFVFSEETLDEAAARIEKTV